MAALLLLLPWLLVPFAGSFVLVQGSNVPAALVLTAPVSLVQAARATETATQGRVVRAYAGTRRRPWGYVLVWSGRMARDVSGSIRSQATSRLEAQEARTTR